MSEDKNNVSSLEAVATVVATDDNVSSSLSDVIVGSSSGDLVNGGSLTSDGSLGSGGLSSLSDLVSGGGLGSDAAAFASTYSAAAMSMLNQTYYAGSLNRAAALSSGGMPEYNVVSTINRPLDNINIKNAANAGETYKYTNNTSQLVTGFGGVGYNGDGHAIYQTVSALGVTSTGVVQIASGNSLLIGSTNAPVGQANFAIDYRPDGSANFIMDEGSYLSANGYVGGVADKSQAGQAVGASDRAARTGNVLAADNVSAEVGGDWGVIGDAATGYNPTTNKFGNNAHLRIGGNLGVFMNASATYGSNLQLNVGGGASAGSGLFIGSGGYMSVGNYGQINITGGMGAAYSGAFVTNKARLYLGDNNSVTLDQANWGNLAAQAGGIVSAGNDFNLRALEISVGYGQVTSTGGILGRDPATINIGSNAIISLGQAGLYDNGQNFYLGSDGAIIVDGSAAGATQGNQLNIGDGAHINANTISIGNYAKDYSGVNSQTNPPVAMQYSFYNTGNNNSVIIGSGAEINLSGGIGLDGNNNVLTLNGGGTSGNTLNAGYISAGRFYKEYVVPLMNSSTNAAGYHFVFDNTSGANVTIGDGYIITLTSGNVSTGLSNQPTISNNGNLMATANNDIFKFGNNIQLNANSVVIGDYSVPVANPTYSTTSLTTGASIAYGTDANLVLSGAVQLNGSGNTMAFGDRLTLNAATMSFGIGAAGGVQRNNTFSAGVSASITVSNAFSNTLVNGNVQLGNNGYIHLLEGDYVLNGSGTAAAAANNNRVTLGDNNQLLLDTGSILVNGQWQTFAIGSNGSVVANTLSVAGTSQTLTFNNGDNVTLNGGIVVDATATTMTFGNNVAMNVGTSGITFNTSTQFTVGTDGSVNVTGDIVFGLNAGSTRFSIGANQTAFNAKNIVINADSPVLTFGAGINYGVTGWNLNGAANKVVLGDGATGSLGDITIGGNATGALFNTGNATNATFGNATFVNDAVFTVNGNVTGQSLSMAGTTTLNVTAGANIDIGTLSLDGTKQVIINVASGGTLTIGSVSTLNVGATNMPVINIQGGTVIVGGQKLRALSSDQYAVNFGTAAQEGIYKYEGIIQEQSGKISLNNFALTDQAIFDIGDQYTDPNRYQTSVVDGVLYIDYIMPDGTRQNLAQFDYTPVTAGQAVPNVVITSDSASSTGYTITITKCFVTGTHILTPEGEVTVENLQAGDQVIALQDGQQVTKTVVWAGHMDVDVNRYEHKDALYPVRIKAHAFGLNQPCRDLLVTPEHTIYVDGGLIPARMLVNGRSIIVDKSMDRFTVYHIETEEHSILLSENLTTESYLNTDDRHLFNGDAVNLHLTFNENAGHQSWENDAVAPLTVAREQVEPIWQRLDRRATQQGYVPVIKQETTKNPDLCLITQKGMKLQPVDIKGNVYSFYVPSNVRVVAMHSKAALPSEVVGPFLDDRRMLGVLVSKISVLGEKSFDILPSDMTGLSGWHPAELNRTDRWTQGLAILPAVVSEVSSQVKIVKIELTTTAEYFVDIIECAEQIA